jgi:hypothetical protein
MTWACSRVDVFLLPRQALHAAHIVPLKVPNAHGPLGLEHLAGAVDQLRKSRSMQPQDNRVRGPIELSVGTWEKLSHLAAATSQATATPLSAGDLVAAIVERYVADTNV